MAEKIKKESSKKITKLICIIIALILITTIVVFAFTGEQTRTTLQATQIELNLQDNDNMHVEEDASGDKVPVPNGYVGSNATGENEIDTGYVIYEGEAEVTDTNVAEAQKTRNQYVWVPVPDISKFYGTDANGKKWGKLYNWTTGTDSSSYFDETTGTYPLNWDETNGVMKIIHKISSNSYREPDIVKEKGNIAYDMESFLKTLELGATTTSEFLIQLEKEFNKMLASVEKYGGFYIGRYETGNLNQTEAVVKKGNTNICNQTWYTMYKKCKTLKGDNTNIETSMVWGNQFDRTLMWLIETESKTKEEVITDSISWGNYNNATFEYTTTSGTTATKAANSSTKIPTGSSEYTKANNIYDLAGNVWDWTMEAYYTYDRSYRGGVYNNDSTKYPVRYRTYFFGPTNSGSLYGCRATLYIK